MPPIETKAGSFIPARNEEEAKAIAFSLALVRQEGNVFWVGATGFEARGERVIIREDEHRSGYECLKCMDKEHHTIEGKEVSVLTCEECKGSGKRPKAGNAELTVKCSDCEGRGFIPCPECKGKGTSTGIIIPDNQKSEPMTGEVVSVGPDAKSYHLGDRVMFPSYAGNRSTLTATEKKTGRKEEVRVRIIQDGDVIAQLYGELEMRSFKGTQALYTSE
jgi:co-chaperonin GroES (HSP10)